MALLFSGTKVNWCVGVARPCECVAFQIVIKEKPTTLQMILGMKARSSKMRRLA